MFPSASRSPQNIMMFSEKKQAEAQKADRDKERVITFFSDNPDPNRAYPCRIEYNAEKEAEWRRAWCSDLEAQVIGKRRSFS